jgi:hypothetical protein
VDRQTFFYFTINNHIRFYNNDLYDVNIGNKSQEPLQLGIRAIIEESILRLLADATGVPYSACMQDDWSYPKKQEVDANKPLQSDPSVGNPPAEGPSLTPTEEIKELIDKHKHPLKGGISK